MIDMLGGGESLNLLDLVIFIIFFYFILSGYKAGLISQISKIFGLIVAIVFAINQFEEFMVYLDPYLDIPPQALQIVSFIIIFIFFNIIIHIISVFFKKIVNFLYLAPLDHIAGAAFGIVKGGVFAYFMVFILNEVPYEVITNLIGSSYFSGPLLELTPLIQENIIEIFTS